MFANMSRGMAVPWLLRAEGRTKQGLGPGGAGGAHCKAPTLPQATGGRTDDETNVVAACRTPEEAPAVSAKG